MSIKVASENLLLNEKENTENNNCTHVFGKLT